VVVTDAQGRFRTAVGEGYAVVDVTAEGYEAKTRVVEIAAHKEEQFDFTLPKHNVIGAVSGQLRDSATGAPVAGRVRVQGAPEWVDADPATGAWQIQGVTEGNVVLEFEAAGHRSQTAEVKIVAGETAVQDATLPADPKADYARLEGEVRDANGAPVAATVTARGNSTVTAKADPANGRYALQVEPGDYAVSAAGAGYASATESVTVDTRDLRRLDWTLAAAPKELTLNGVQFDSGGATIKRESFTALEQAAKFLSDHPDVQVVVQGHTDDVGSPETNLALSQRRADAVLKYLIVNYGVDPTRLVAKGMGAQAPVAPNDTEENRARNRRIELLVAEDGQQ
jgi:outer membrane protein OmpA-like peptidoglycan-associated protein